MAKMIAVAFGALVLVAMAVLVWPTRYVQTSYANYPVRIDRFTGEAEVLRTWGWSKMTNQRTEVPSTVPAQIFGNPPPPQPQIEPARIEATPRPAPTPFPQGQEWRRFYNPPPVPQTR